MRSQIREGSRRLQAWFRGDRYSQLLAKPLPAAPANKQGIPWWKAGAFAAAALLIVAPRPARGQFGFDTVALLAALQQLNQLMSDYVAKPLQAISKVEQTIYKYQQEVVYPIQKINQARANVGQLENQAHSLNALFHLNLSSATLPQSRALESVLLSRNPGNLNDVSTQYQTVYGPVMPEKTAAPAARTMTDITDAQAQDAMKRSVQIDALADYELAMADQLGQEIKTAAPGTAPIYEADTAAWVVRSNAYTQAALSELMRTRAVDLSNQSAHLKIGATHNVANGQFITSTLSH